MQTQRLRLSEQKYYERFTFSDNNKGGDSLGNASAERQHGESHYRVGYANVVANNSECPGNEIRQNANPDYCHYQGEKKYRSHTRRCYCQQNYSWIFDSKPYLRAGVIFLSWESTNGFLERFHRIFLAIQGILLQCTLSEVPSCKCM